MMYCARDGRRLQPYKPKGKSHYYYCSLRRGNALGGQYCTLPQVNGQEIEKLVWDSIFEFLSHPVVFMAEIERRQGGVDCEQNQVETTIKDLQHKVEKLKAAEADLALERFRPDNESKLSDEAYHRAGALLRAERVHYEEEIKRQEAIQVTYREQTEALETLANIRGRLADKLTDATPEEKRWVLQCLKTHVKVHPGKVEISVGVPEHLTDSVQNTRVLRLASLT